MDACFAAFVIILALTPVWIMALQACVIRLGIVVASGQVIAMLSSIGAVAPVGSALWAVYLATLSGPELLGASVYAALTYSLLAYSYFHIFNMGETARRVRILSELRERGKLSEAELKSFYNSAAILDRRMERLVALGQVRVEGGRVLLKSRRLFMAASLMDWWGRVLGLPSLKGRQQR
ncbi:hypothetical protein BAC1_00651 [uncultured bacterium]|nr:hypothetical protein BAC1_00651 [uncultured bacterium]